MTIFTTNTCETRHSGSQGGSHRPPTGTEPMPGFDWCYLGENAARTRLPRWQRSNEVVKGPFMRDDTGGDLHNRVLATATPRRARHG